MLDKSFFKQLQVGDLITAYHKGYWVVTKIEHRYINSSLQCLGCYQHLKVGDEYNSLVFYSKVANAHGRILKSKTIKCCDESYCSLINQDLLQKKQEEFQVEISNLQDLISKYGKQ